MFPYVARLIVRDERPGYSLLDEQSLPKRTLISFLSAACAMLDSFHTYTASNGFLFLHDLTGVRLQRV